MQPKQNHLKYYIWSVQALLIIWEVLCLKQTMQTKSLQRSDDWLALFGDLKTVRSTIVLHFYFYAPVDKSSQTFKLKNKCFFLTANLGKSLPLLSVLPPTAFWHVPLTLSRG